MYDFRETTPFTGSDDNQRPAEAMLIDGQYIEELIPGYSTLQVSGRELLSQSIEKQTIGKSDGEFIQYVRNPSREIVVGYRLAAADNLSFRQAFYKLNSILHGDSHQVSFNDDPSKYWIATFSDIDDVPKGRNAITSSFTLFVPDGIAHSVATQTFNNTPYKNLSDNLLHNTGDDWNPIVWSPDGTTTTQDGITTATNTSKSVIQTVVDPNDSSWLVSGATVTISVDVKGQGSIGFGYFTGSGWEDDSPTQQVNSDEYIRLYFTRTINSTHFDTGNPNFAVDAFCPTSTLTFRHVKADLGPTASPWSPNPADPEYYADTITVHNGGTYPVEPVITATMHADNGLIAFINSQGGVLQFGNPEEADGVERQRSEVARYEGFDKEPAGAAYNTGQTNSHYYYIAAQKNVMEGSVKYADDDGSAVEPVFLPTNSYYWEGPSLHLKTTNASDGSNTGSFLAKWRYKFNSNVSALGAIEMTLDNDTGVAYQVIIRANYAGKDDVDVQVFAGSTLVFQQTLNRSVFSNGRYYEAKLTKLGNTLNLQLAGIVQGGIKPSEVVTRNTPLIMPPIMLTSAQTSLPITGATLWFQRFENYPYPDMGVYDMDIEWLNVDYWTDLSNRFSAGDVATIDVANRQILVNGVINADLQLIDNDWKKFKLLPGDTQILTQRSSWAQPYEVEVALREAFL
ncbi:MAG: distal tail protein Dit [Lacticaseibacillus paracasei]